MRRWSSSSSIRAAATGPERGRRPRPGEARTARSPREAGFVARAGGGSAACPGGRDQKLARTPIMYCEVRSPNSPSPTMPQVSLITNWAPMVPLNSLS